MADTSTSNGIQTADIVQKQFFTKLQTLKADYNIKVNLKENEKPSLILYNYRWVVLFSYFLSSAATGVV